MRVKWNKGALRKIRMDPKVDKVTDQVARRIAANGDGEILPNSNRRNRGGTTVAANRPTHQGRMRLLSALR